LPWLWSSSQTGASSSTSHRKSKRRNSQSGAAGGSSRHKAPRTHAQKIGLETVRRDDASGMSSLLVDILQGEIKIKQINRNSSWKVHSTTLVLLISLEHIAS
jgi:hypothetical protein